MEKTLEKMGFTHFTGRMWTHPDYGLITIKDEDNWEKIVCQQIFDRGGDHARKLILVSLGIREQYAR